MVSDVSKSWAAEALLQTWFEVRFEADLYLSEQGPRRWFQCRYAPEVLQALESLPELEFADTLYMTRVQTWCYAINGGRFCILAASESADVGCMLQLAPVTGAEPALVGKFLHGDLSVLREGLLHLRQRAGYKGSRRLGFLLIMVVSWNCRGSTCLEGLTFQNWVLNTSLYLKPGSDSRDSGSTRLEFPALDIRIIMSCVLTR